MRLWGLEKKNQKTRAQLIVPLVSAAMEDVRAALDELVKGMDLSRPIMLDKHEQELTTYGKTAFLPRDFVETVSFDRLEIEILFDEKAEKKRSRDPRNDFSY